MNGIEVINTNTSPLETYIAERGERLADFTNDYNQAMGEIAGSHQTDVAELGMVIIDQEHHLSRAVAFPGGLEGRLQQTTEQVGSVVSQYGASQVMELLTPPAQEVGAYLAEHPGAQQSWAAIRTASGREPVWGNAVQVHLAAVDPAHKPVVGALFERLAYHHAQHYAAGEEGVQGENVARALDMLGPEARAAAKVGLMSEQAWKTIQASRLPSDAQKPRSERTEPIEVQFNWVSSQLSAEAGDAMRAGTDSRWLEAVRGYFKQNQGNVNADTLNRLATLNSSPVVGEAIARSVHDEEIAREQQEAGRQRRRWFGGIGVRGPRREK